MKDVAVVILAAGGSSRMGSPKQLLVYKASTLLQHAIQTARDVFGDNVCVVLGAQAALIADAVPAAGFSYAINENWRNGMGSSIAFGLREVVAMLPGLSAVMFMTVDQPFIDARHLNQMLAEYNLHRKGIVASQYKETAGIPAIFDQRFFPELLKLNSDKGAKEIIRLNIACTTLLPLALGEIDIDTPEQYAALQSR